MNLIELFRDRALKYPHFPAIIDRDRKHFFARHSRITSFGNIEYSSQRLARLLYREGVRPKEGVLIFYPLSVELYIVLAAVFRLGLVAIFLDPSAGKKHIDRCCQLYPPRVLIGSTRAHFLQINCLRLRQITLKISLGCPFPQTISWQEIEDLSPYPDIYPCDRDAPALLTFTSGSTGQPKATMRSHGFLWAQYKIVTRTLQLEPAKLELSTLPIFILANLASGLTSLIPDVDLRFPGRIRADRAIRQIQKYNPSRLVASPGFLECLLDWCRDRSLTLPQIAKIFVGGAPVMPRTLSQLKEVFPSAKITVVYGSTEAEPISSISEAEMTREDWQKMRSGRGLVVGKPVSEIQLKIISLSEEVNLFLSENEFKYRCLSRGKIGEIIVNGNHVLQGYLQNNDKKMNKIHVNDLIWHRTGDMGYLDEWGRLWLLGRRSACIRDRFGILYPFAVECAVNCHLEIRRSAIVSWQGKRILFIELYKKKKQFDLKSLQHSLDRAKIVNIEIRSQIPTDKRHNAKIDYSRLYQNLERKMRKQK
ncbi:MAG: AMP-binding protein [Cyanobacteria bacterium SBLK]|nr:AMP-binding protein [Cyanobacteria bacterium SBLK]